MDLPVTQEQLDAFFEPGRTQLVQQMFPNLDPAQREFLITGVTPEEWNAAFPDEE